MTHQLDDEYYNEAVNRINQWVKSGGPEALAIWTELKTFYDLGFRHGYKKGIENYGHWHQPSTPHGIMICQYVDPQSHARCKNFCASESKDRCFQHGGIEG